jgi:hypothetical protein
VSDPDRLLVRDFLMRVSRGNATFGDVEDRWPTARSDALIGSIRFWLWTQFDDDAAADSPLRLAGEDVRVLANCLRFLEGDDQFTPQPRGGCQAICHVLADGIEWRGCELPWHRDWPFPPG